MKLRILATTALLTTPFFLVPAHAQSEICIVARNNEVICGRAASESELRRYRQDNNSESERFRRHISIVSIEGKCIDVVSESNNQNGTELQLWDCNGGSSQRWNYDPENRTIRGSGGKCLDAAAEGRDRNGTKLQLWSCNGDSTQQWTYDSDNRTIRGSSGKCIDAASEGRNNNGTKLQLWSCNNGRNQKWRFFRN